MDYPYYLEVKTLHLILVVSWFAGLFYLPRLFVNLAMVPADSLAERDRLLLMSGKLYRFMTPLGYLALISGFWLWLGVGIGGPWMHAKLLLVAGLVGYNFYCKKILRDFQNGSNTRSHIWFRWFNEAPTLVLFVVTYLVVFKPF
ncbi:MAG: CopD family protein [Betaproteobacteria bacterium]